MVKVTSLRGRGVVQTHRPPPPPPPCVCPCHPPLHSWSPFFALMDTLLCTHGHPYLHTWTPISALMVTFHHPSLHSWSPQSTLMVTLLCTHRHPSQYAECTKGKKGMRMESEANTLGLPAEHLLLIEWLYYTKHDGE